jgi:hypothetical protein
MNKTTQIKELIDEAMMEKLECFLIPKPIQIVSSDDWSNLDRIRIIGYNWEGLIFSYDTDFYRTANRMKWSSVCEIYDLLLTQDIYDDDYSKIVLHRWDLEKVKYIKVEQVKV